MSQLSQNFAISKAVINPRTINRVRRCFLEVNEERLIRTQRSLNNRQQIFLEALPLLLHTNHPLLPGYVSHQTPCGVSGFEPTKHHIRAVRNIVKSFNYNETKNSKEYIHNISLMGSCGTIAHSRSSDMDFWVCYQPGMKPELLNELEQKLRGIEKWADSIGLEVYFFPMDLEQFKSGERKDVSGEDCGSAQHYLLLDEFYRTSLLIAGRLPLWWMVPVEHEQNYIDFTNMLIKENLINGDEYIDFGGIPSIPAGEFIGAGMWQLYKGVESPYKSVIKILLTEVYASEYPEVRCLSQIYKQAIYENNTDINFLDPYVMLYRKLEAYLIERKELPRLELVRRCFYFKANEPMSKPAPKSAIGWRRSLMEELIAEWEWPPKQLTILDTRKNWKVDRTVIERKALVNELNHSYRFLSRFARDYKSQIKISQQDMNILGRKLYATFERKTGKIELVNPNITSNITEEYLTVVYSGSRSAYSKNNVWIIYRGEIDQRDLENHDPIKRGRSIVELIGWCYFNKILTTSTRLSLLASKSDMNEHELKNIVLAFKNAFPEGISGAPQENFHSTHRPIRNLIFINVGVDPLRELNKKGIQKITSQTDALNFSGLHTNLVNSIEQITINSWHEIVATKFEGAESAINCALEFLRNLPPNKGISLPKQDILCFCPTRAETISRRISALFNEIISCFYESNGGVNKRFLLEIENQFFVFQFNGTQPTVSRLPNFNHLLKHLSKPQKHFTPIMIDSQALKSNYLNTVCQRMSPNTIQVFYCFREAKRVDIYVVDEIGSIQYFFCKQSEYKNYLLHLSRFLQSIWYRISSEHESGTSYRQEPILFYEMAPPKKETPGEITQRHPNKTFKDDSNFYIVQVMISTDANDQSTYTVYCNQSEFSELKYGDHIFKAVAKHVLSLRKKREKYPIYITDLDLSDAAGSTNTKMQTNQYLQYKLVLETQLNKALQAI